MEKLEFIKIMLANRYLSLNDKRRLINLATNEIGADDKANAIEVLEGSDRSDTFLKKILLKQRHKPKDTASFLSLFNDPAGFKYLTHDYAPGVNIEYDAFLEQVRDTFEKNAKEYTIPKTLYSLMNTVLNGGVDERQRPKTWRSFDGKPQKENYASESWIDWARNNPNIHLLSNDNVRRTIMLFRNTIRVVKPALNDIVQGMREQYANMEIHTQKLDKADFYTYVYYLKEGIKRILDDISQYQEHPEVHISFMSEYGDDFSKRIIRITQTGSKAANFEQVRERFNGGGGAFNEIRDTLLGYCNWSVEALWDGEAKRWNLLDDNNAKEVEELNATEIDGFTHVLTYYYK